MKSQLETKMSLERCQDFKKLNQTTASEMIEFWRERLIENPVLQMPLSDAQKIAETMNWYWINAGISYEELLNDFLAWDGSNCPENLRTGQDWHNLLKKNTDPNEKWDFVMPHLLVQSTVKYFKTLTDKERKV